MRSVGMVISDTEPASNPNRDIWLKINPDNSREWYQKEDGGWVLVQPEPAPALEGHSHPTHGDINFTGTVSADGDAGLTGERTVGGYKITFKKGLLVGFEPV